MCAPPCTLGERLFPTFLWCSAVVVQTVVIVMLIPLETVTPCTRFDA